ncbi:MAG TPA: HU family DNA-binding protein [Kofleriaceae bacterium]|nr:HU family DNA-binding protein [Kofleriaceae bacterium]
MPVTKSELIEQLSESLKLPKGKAELVVNVMFDAMVGALERGERIEIRGFGSFEVRSYKPYEGRNPRTGEPVHVKAKRLPFFKVGKELRERVNASTGALEADDHDEDVVGDDELGPDADDDGGNGEGNGNGTHE